MIKEILLIREIFEVIDGIIFFKYMLFYRE